MRKIRITRMLLTLTVAMAWRSFSSYADNSALDAWKGEWVGYGTSAHGMTIRDCEDPSTCNASFFGLSSFDVSCLRDGPVTMHENGETMTATLKAPKYGDPNEVCTVLITREASSDDGSIVAKLSNANGTSCNLGGCPPFKSGEERRYRRVSKEPFVRDIALVGECYQLTTPAGHAWCTDQKLQDLIKRSTKVPFAAAGWSWEFDKVILKKCDAEKDVTGCLHRGFDQKLAALEAASDGKKELYAVSGDSKTAKLLLDKIGGVYKRRFQNGNVSGDTYESENILEIVPVTQDAAYIKAHLEFFNGHLCGIAGIFKYTKVGGFVYQDPEEGNRCLLTLKVEGDSLTFDDPAGTCSSMCGTRGGFNGETFDLKQRRTIRYMPTILKSEEYREAVAQLKKKSNSK